MEHNIFKGVSPYTEEDVKTFKGRKLETKSLEYLVIHSDFSVCYAESGEGKTSLINAGLIPMLRKENMFPVRIIFNDNDFNIENPSATYFNDVVFAKISEAIESAGNVSSSIEAIQQQFDKYKNLKWTNLTIDKSLGERLRTEFITNGEENFFPILIFDQFEEVFTRPQNNSWTNSFFKWLEQLYKDCKPKEFGDTYANKFKVLVSLRSDYLCELDYWAMTKCFIPSFKNNRYCLKALTKEGAYDVVKSLPEKLLNGFVCDDIIEFAKIEKAGDINQDGYDLPCISALMLGIILSFLERGLGKKTVQNISLCSDSNKKTLLNTILEEYYEDSMSRCNISAKEKEYIETSLIDTKGQRRRISLSDEDLDGISKDKLEKLADKRIVNIINNEVEISHDCLKSIIDKHNKERLIKIENKLFYSWESAIFTFICIGCFFLITYMWEATAKHIEVFKQGEFNVIGKNADVFITLIFTFSLLPLPFVAFLRFYNNLKLNRKSLLYPLIVLCAGYLSVFHFMDFDIFEAVFNISTDLVKSLCYIYILSLTLLIVIVYTPQIKLLQAKFLQKSAGKDFRCWCELPNINILWIIFFVVLAALLQISRSGILGQWILICCLLCFSYIYILNVVCKNKVVRNSCLIVVFAFIFYSGYSFYSPTSLHRSSALSSIFILLSPIIIGFFCEKSILKKCEMALLFLCANLLSIYVLTKFTNPLLLLEGYGISKIGEKGYVIVTKNGKETVCTNLGTRMFDIKFDENSISKYQEGLNIPVSTYRIPIRNTQESLFKDDVRALPFSVFVTNDSVDIYRSPNFWGDLNAIIKGGTSEEKLTGLLCVALTKFMIDHTNEPVCESRIPEISDLYLSFEESLKRYSCIKNNQDIIRLQQIMTNYIYTAIIRDAIRDNRKADAMKILTFLSYSCLGNTPIYKGLNTNFNIKGNFSTNDSTALFYSIKNMDTIKLSHAMMRSSDPYVQDSFWYNNFIASLMLSKKFILEYSMPCIMHQGHNPSIKTAVKSNSAEALEEDIEASLASQKKKIEELKNRIEFLTNDDEYYLTKALVNCTNQICVLLQHDANQKKHDWRSLLEFRFLVNLYNVLPIHGLISKSRNEILEQEKQLSKNFNQEADNIIKNLQNEIKEYEDKLNQNQVLYNKLKPLLKNREKGITIR